jgi:hypothetical protein
MKRACLDCKRLTTTTRCPTCHANYRARYNSDWQRLARAQRTAEPQCAWCHTTTDLTADHIVPGRADLGIRTLCRPCNTRRKNGGAGVSYPQP